MESQEQGSVTTVPPSGVMQSSGSSNELIYASTNSATGSEDVPHHVMSDKVQMVASSIYKEFESTIQKFGQDSVKDLMPLVVNVLESLDATYTEKDEIVVDLEMLKEENEQLLNQYERERQMRRNQDQKCLEMEETYLEQNRELESKLESMASIVRMLELKTKNATDHANRLEEREAEQKAEYEKLHERYNELLRTHIEHVERTKFLMGAEIFDMAQSLPINAKNNKNMMAMSAIDTNVRGISDLISAVHMSQSTHADMNLANHISSERDWHDEFGGEETAAEILATPRERETEGKRKIPKIEEASETGEAIEQEEMNPIERTNAEGDAISLGADLTGMGREVENLIRENSELLETKNALNIVKNDLIARMDQLTSEQEVFREEVRSLELVKLKLGERIRDLESELKELKERNLQDETAEQEDMAQRKRFTRVEMARVLMERNQYKEKLFELQEAVKLTELRRAKKTTIANQNKPTIWSFFSNLLGDSTTAASTARHPPYATKKPSSLKKNIPSSPMAQRRTRIYTVDNEVEEKRMAERRQHYQAVSRHLRQEDLPNAYGWSIPPVKSSVQNMSMPVPVNCMPLQEHIPSLKICCAAPGSLYGGLNNGEYIVGDPMLGCDPYLLLQNSLLRANDSDSENSNKTIGDLKKLNGGQFSLLESSSLLWICSINEQQKPYITILDPNNPNCILESFVVEAVSEHLCIAGIPGVVESNVRITSEGLSEASELCTAGGYFQEKTAEVNNSEHLGKVEFVRLRNLDEDYKTYIAEGQPNVTASPNKKRYSSTNEPEETTEKYKSPSPFDTLPLHIRNTLKRYEAVGSNDILTLPTIWMGTENEYIYIYSAVKEWRKCLRSIRMPDAVLFILHSNGRVFVALANGCVAVFHRDMDGQWSSSGYHVIHFGPSDASICNLCEVNSKIWAAYKNSVIIFDPITLRIDNIFVAHPRKDSKIRQMVHYGNGVWLSIRLDSTIRLFHAETYQHLQDIDVESFITKMLGPNKLDLVLLRITSLSIMDKRIWIGTGSGIIVSIPFNDDSVIKKSSAEKGKTPGQVVRVVSEESSSVLPFCEISHAQLSFHSFKDPVRFLIPVFAEGFSDITPNSEAVKLYMISGGDGYIDFRLGDEDANDSKSPDHVDSSVRVRDMSHLLIWESECKMNWTGEAKTN